MNENKNPIAPVGSFLLLVILVAVLLLPQYLPRLFQDAEPSPEPTPMQQAVAQSPTPSAQPSPKPIQPPSFDYERDVPPSDGETPWVEVNGSTPYFISDDLTETAYESYSALDGLGRCGVAVACIGTETMPTEPRGEIGMIKPSGWHTVRYDIVDGKYLYNRCHLIGHQLTGEDANERNLITGTRYMNIDGMLGLENAVADYVESTGNHVLYRVTPVFCDDELLARGVLMEAYSVEDLGDGVCACIFAYNIQPGVVIDYATGESYLEKE